MMLSQKTLRKKMMYQRVRVKELAQANGFTMAKLQRAADMNIKTLQALYKDPYIDVAYSTLRKIAQVLELPITELVEMVPFEQYEVERPKKGKRNQET